MGLEAVCGVKTINEIGQEYGVHPIQVGQRKKAIQEQASTLFEGKRGPTPVTAHREPDRLYSEIGKLKKELDWLKKSPESAYRPSRLRPTTTRCFNSTICSVISVHLVQRGHIIHH